MSKMFVEEFEDKAKSHLERFIDAVNSDSETSDLLQSEDDWWKLFTEFSLELNNNE